MSKASRLLTHIREATNSPSDFDDYLQKEQKVGISFSDLNRELSEKGYNPKPLQGGTGTSAIEITSPVTQKKYLLIQHKKEGGTNKWALVKDVKGGDNPTGKMWFYGVENQPNSPPGWKDFSDTGFFDTSVLTTVKNILKTAVDKDGKPQVKANDASYQSNIRDLVKAINSKGNSKETLVLALTGKKPDGSADEEGGEPNWEFGKWFLAKNFENQDLFVVTKDKERVYVLGKFPDGWQIASPTNSKEMDDYQIYDKDNNTMVTADTEIKKKYKTITNAVRNMKFKKDFFKDTTPESKIDKAGAGIGGYAGMLLGGPLGAYVGKKAGEWAANKIKKTF